MTQFIFPGTTEVVAEEIWDLRRTIRTAEKRVLSPDSAERADAAERIELRRQELDELEAGERWLRDGASEPTRLVLLFVGGKNSTDLPVPLGPDETFVLVRQWLAQLPSEERIDFADLDGSVEPKGFRIRADNLDSDLGGWNAIEVTGVWAWYHK